MNGNYFSKHEERIITRSIGFAREQMRTVKPSHGWDHVARVVELAERIARTEMADLFIVKTAAILHDIGRADEDASGGKVCHAELGSDRAYEFFRAEGLVEEQARHIADCILSHRFRNEHRPETPEARSLFDADKIDSIGAVGIGRAFLFAGEVGARLHNAEIEIHETEAYSHEDTAYREYMVKLRLIKDRLTTGEGRRLAASRHEYMEQFFRRIQDEVEGRA